MLQAFNNLTLSARSSASPTLANENSAQLKGPVGTNLQSHINTVAWEMERRATTFYGLGCNLETAAHISEQKFLDWRDRPAKLKADIFEVWHKRIHYDHSAWGVYNGADHYNLMDINEHSLLKALILNNPGRKKFTVLDLGAGNFQFGRALAKFLNAQTDLAKDLKITIISLRAELNLAPECQEVGMCTLLEYGHFKIEELHEELANKNLLLHNMVDLIVSRWTLVHLADPAGTFIQTYHLLKPQTGFFLADGFMIGTDIVPDPVMKAATHKLSSGNFRIVNHVELKLMTFLKDLKAPFLCNDYHKTDQVANQFIIRRPNGDLPQIPLTYTESGRYVESASDKQIQLEPHQCRLAYYHKEYELLVGDQALYDFLIDNAIFQSPDKQHYEGPLLLSEKSFSKKRCTL